MSDIDPLLDTAYRRGSLSAATDVSSASVHCGRHLTAHEPHGSCPGTPEASSAARVRFAWLRAHRIGEPWPWYKRWFAEAEWRVRKAASRV